MQLCLKLNNSIYKAVRLCGKGGYLLPFINERKCMKTVVYINIMHENYTVYENYYLPPATLQL